MPRVNLSCLVGLRMETLFCKDLDLLPVDPTLVESAQEAQIADYMSNDLVRDPMGNVIVSLSFSCSHAMGSVKSCGNGDMQLFPGKVVHADPIKDEAQVLANAWSYMTWLLELYPDTYFVAPSIAPHAWRFMICRSQKYGIIVPCWAMDGLDIRVPYSRNQRLLCPLDAFRHGAKDMRNTTMKRLAVYFGLKDQMPTISDQDMAIGLDKSPIPEEVLTASLTWARLNREILYRLESCFL